MHCRSSQISLKEIISNTVAVVIATVCYISEIALRNALQFGGSVTLDHPPPKHGIHCHVLIDRNVIFY